jgi:hypothetical protein
VIPFLTQRDVEASLWQSAVDAAVASTAAAATPLPTQQNPFARLGAVAAAALSHFEPAAAPAPPPSLDPTHLGIIAANVAHSFSGDEDQFREALRITKFGQFDPLWLEAAVNYLRFLRFSRKDVPYRPYDQLGNFVIDDKLPARARIALVSDWGTGQPEAVEVLKQIAAHQPHVVIHLGDIYYSGQLQEVQDRFWQPWHSVLDLNTVATFTLSGNHDMYSGGKGYYFLLDKLQQPASYFCLRNKDWQFIAVDTGLFSGVLSTEVTRLHDDEPEWVIDKVTNADGRNTVLLSHHPLFSAFEKIGDQGDGINHELLKQLKDVLPELTAWFWGHEHDLAIYDTFLGIRARCIGHGAIPVTQAGRPLPNPNLGMTVLAPQTPLGMTGDFYNHGYALIDLDGPAAHVRYFQSSDPDNPQHEEDLA